jgi:hypothetical protein
MRRLVRAVAGPAIIIGLAAALVLGCPRGVLCAGERSEALPSPCARVAR